MVIMENVVMDGEEVLHTAKNHKEAHAWAKNKLKPNKTKSRKRPVRADTPAEKGDS